MHLAVDDQGIQNGAGVIACHVTHNLNPTGLAVDLHHANVGPEGKGRCACLIERFGGQRLGSGGREFSP